MYFNEQSLNLQSILRSVFFSSLPKNITLNTCRGS